MMQVVVTQIPAPAPPAPPDMVVVGNSGPPPELFVLFALVIGAVLLWPLIRAWARRIEGRTDQALQRQVDELEQRVSELSQREYRMAELEERLDFAERLLAQRAEPAALPRKAEE
ncbi:MAG TPA: hypothetical protein VFY20_12060 [Gemmatimonadales bacterium]|nr:hypothetical protein [Gemmatimonadales bacterium]